MYKVLLVDDEPLILAGIKSMIDWQEIGCELIGNARNGKQALEILEEQRPDIVIADINMPVMNGVELLAESHSRYPEIVFLMLSNLQEFELARSSLRYKAVDYLIKNMMDAQVLVESLEKAKTEADKRRRASGSVLQEGIRRVSEEKILSDALKLFLSAPEVPAEVENTFMKNGILEKYCLINIQFLYSENIVSREMDTRSIDELYGWELEVIGELTNNCFEKAAVAEINPKNRQAVICIWGSKDFDYQNHIDTFYKKLCIASEDITGLVPCMQVSDLLSGSENLLKCRRQIHDMANFFYLSGKELIRYAEVPDISYAALGLSGISGSLKKDMKARNMAGCSALFERAVARLQQVPHEKSQGLWLCTDLYAAVGEVLGENPENIESGIFTDADAGYAQINLLVTRDDIIRFLTAVSNELQGILQPSASRYEEIAEQVKKYVYENIENRISLHEAAEQVCLSAGYLSAIFKKHCGESFVDFVNRSKIERACEILEKENCRIGEVGDRLSFENAYYFARVFKRYMGITPSEYQEQNQKQS